MRDVGSRFEISRRFGELWNIWGLRGWLYVVDVGFGMYIGVWEGVGGWICEVDTWNRLFCDFAW